MTPTVLWWRTLGIAVVQGAITLAWVIYALYLPQLLVQLGFTKELAPTLLILENALEAIIEPVTGGLSDRAQHFMGTRFPLIIVGAILASALFIGLPAIAIFGGTNSPIRWLFPIMAVAWALAMSIFRSPALALLGRAAPPVQLPLAAASLTLAQQLFGAFRFESYGVILKLGPMFAFGLGSFVLLGAVAFLRWVTPPSPPEQISRSFTSLSTPGLFFIVGGGLGIAIGLRFLFATVATASMLQLGEQAKLGLLFFSIALALTALPAGKLATWISNSGGMILGIVVTILGLGIVTLLPESPLLIGVGVIVSFAFSLVLNGMVPFALGLVPPQWAGLGVGLFFGAFVGGISFFDWLFVGIKGLDQIATGGALSLAIAGIFIVSSMSVNLRIES